MKKCAMNVFRPKSKEYQGQQMSKMDASTCIVKFFSMVNLRKPVGVKKFYQTFETNFSDIFLIIKKTDQLS